MLLAIDTSTRSIGIALYDGVRVQSEAVWVSTNHHSVELASAVSQALQRTAFKVRDLQAVGVALGPGSFTSLRVGLAFAKGLALANHLPLIGVPTLDVIAYAQAPQRVQLVALLEAGRGRLAAGWYRVIDGTWQPTGQLELLTARDLAQRIRRPMVFCGEMSGETRRILGRKYKRARMATPARSIRRPGFLAELAWKRWENNQIDDPAELKPIYLQHTQ